MSVKSIQSTDKSLWFDIGEINQIVQDIQATPFKDAETFDEKNYVLNSFWSEYIKASSGNLSQKKLLDFFSAVNRTGVQKQADVKNLERRLIDLIVLNDWKVNYFFKILTESAQTLGF